MAEPCPLCGQQAATSGDPINQTWDCPNCGKFTLTNRAAKTLPIDDAGQLALISHVVGRTKRDRSEPLMLTQNLVRSIQDVEQFPTVGENWRT